MIAWRRFAAHPLAQLLLAVGLFALTLGILAWVSRQLALPAWFAGLRFALAALAALSLLRIEGLPTVERSARGAAVELGLGVALGGTLMSLVIGVLWLGGWYRVEALGPLSPRLLGAFCFIGLGAAAEEVLFRGVLFRALERWRGSYAALVASGALFGVAHLSNPHATPVAALAIAVEAGALLAAAFVLTRGLWLPIGIHWGWNLFEGPVFGTQISGGSAAAPLFTATVSGPELLSGGGFGPEAGLPAVLICSAVAVAMWRMAMRRERLWRPGENPR